MTGITLVAGEMNSGFAQRNCAVVAATATSIYLGMIYSSHRAPASGCMTGITGVAGIWVAGVFAGCGGAIMAARAATGNLRVINAHHRGEC